jgi:hypothetical protein
MRGDIALLLELKKAARHLESEMKTTIIQPGISKSEVEKKWGRR